MVPDLRRSKGESTTSKIGFSPGNVQERLTRGTERTTGFCGLGLGLENTWPWPWPWPWLWPRPFYPRTHPCITSVLPVLLHSVTCVTTQCYLCYFTVLPVLLQCYLYYFTVLPGSFVIVVARHLCSAQTIMFRWRCWFLLFYSSLNLRSRSVDRHQILPLLKRLMYEIGSEIWGGPSSENLAVWKHQNVGPILDIFATLSWTFPERNKISSNGKTALQTAISSALAYFGPRKSKNRTEFWSTQFGSWAFFIAGSEVWNRLLQSAWSATAVWQFKITAHYFELHCHWDTIDKHERKFWVVIYN